MLTISQGFSFSNMKTAYILVGIPGSGKSTWITQQLALYDYKIISTDNYVEKFARRLNTTYSEVFDSVIHRAIRLMFRALRNATANDKNIIWDQTSTSRKARAKKLRLLDNYYTIAVVFSTPTDEELSRRLRTRPGKHIPGFVLKQMINQFTVPSLDEGFNEIIII